MLDVGLRLCVGGLLTANLSSKFAAAGGLEPAKICPQLAEAWVWFDDPILGISEQAPVYGNDIKVVRSLVRGGSYLCRDIGTLANSFQSKSPIQSLRKIGATNFEAHSLSAIDQVALTGRQLSKIDSKSLHWGLGVKLQKLQRMMVQFNRAEPKLRNLVSVASAVLAGEPNEKWFIATQNLAEARGTGGILGSYLVLKVGQDKLELGEAGSDQDLARLGPVKSESLPIDTALTYGVDPKLWQDLNPSAHAPYTARQIYDSWYAHKREKLAGVIFIGQGLAQDLVGLTGPLSHDGVRLDSSNMADFMAKGIYAKFPDVSDKNTFVQGMMKKLSSKLESGHLDFNGFLKSVVSNQTGDKIFAWSSNSVLEKALISDHSAGSVDAIRGNTVWVTYNNGGGNKLDAYMHASIDYRVSITGTGNSSISSSSLNLVLTNEAPAQGLPPYVAGRLDLKAGEPYLPGSNVDLISVYLPVGAEPTGFLVNNRPFSVHDAYEREHEVLSFRIETNPGSSKHLWIGWQQRGKALSYAKPVVISPATYSPGSVNSILQIQPK